MSGLSHVTCLTPRDRAESHVTGLKSRTHEVMMHLYPGRAHGSGCAARAIHNENGPRVQGTATWFERSYERAPSNSCIADWMVRRPLRAATSAATRRFAASCGGPSQSCQTNPNAPGSVRAAPRAMATTYGVQRLRTWSLRASQCRGAPRLVRVMKCAAFTGNDDETGFMDLRIGFKAQDSGIASSARWHTSYSTMWAASRAVAPAPAARSRASARSRSSTPAHGG